VLLPFVVEDVRLSIGFGVQDESLQPGVAGRLRGDGDVVQVDRPVVEPVDEGAVRRGVHVEVGEVVGEASEIGRLKQPDVLLEDGIVDRDRFLGEDVPVAEIGVGRVGPVANQDRDAVEGLLLHVADVVVDEPCGRLAPPPLQELRARLSLAGDRDEKQRSERGEGKPGTVTGHDAAAKCERRAGRRTAEKAPERPRFRGMSRAATSEPSDISMTLRRGSVGMHTPADARGRGVERDREPKVWIGVMPPSAALECALGVLQACTRARRPA